MAWTLVGSDSGYYDESKALYLFQSGRSTKFINGNRVTYDLYGYGRDGVSRVFTRYINHTFDFSTYKYMIKLRGHDVTEIILDNINIYRNTAYYRPTDNIKLTPEFGAGYYIVNIQLYRDILNTRPTITDTTIDNSVIYEGDSLLIRGYARDVDIGDEVTVQYSVNDGPTRNITKGISTGSNNIPYNMPLRYSQGVLKQGSTTVAFGLIPDTNYAFKVWSVDSSNVKSAIVTKYFKVGAFPNISFKVGGVLRKGIQGYVKINSTLRPIQKIYVKHNGVIKEV